MVEHACPFGLLGHARELGAADAVDERQRLVSEQDRLPVVHFELVDIRPRRQLEIPRVLRGRPGAEAAASGRIGLLVAGAEEARQRRIGRSRQQAAIAEEGVALLEGFDGPVGCQPAQEATLHLQLVEPAHGRI